MRVTGDWYNHVQWDWYAWLTFKNQIGEKEAYKKFNKWKVTLKKAVKNKISYVMAIETPPYNRDHLHIHVLLLGANNELPYKWEQEWYRTAGIAKIRQYDRNQGVNYYMGDKLISGECITKFSSNLVIPNLVM